MLQPVPAVSLSASSAVSSPRQAALVGGVSSPSDALAVVGVGVSPGHEGEELVSLLEGHERTGGAGAGLAEHPLGHTHSLGHPHGHGSLGIGDDDSGSGSRAQAKRLSKVDWVDKSERRRSRGSAGSLLSQSDGWNLRENLHWLWAGSPQAGLLCMLAASLCHALMGLLVSLFAVHSIPAFEALLVRCAVIAAASAAVLHRTGHPLLGSPPVRLLLAARAALGFLALAAFFFSLRLLSVPLAVFLSFTAPAMTAALAGLLLEERVAGRDVAGISCCLLGLLLLLQPSLFRDAAGVVSASVAAAAPSPLPAGALPPPPASAAVPSGPSTLLELLLGAAVALLSAAACAGAFAIARAVGKTGEPPASLVFSFAAVSCPASLLCLLIFQEFVLPSTLEFVGMLLVSAAAFAGQLLLCRSLQLEKAARASAMCFMEVVASHLLGLLFLGEQPSLHAACGSLLVCAATAFVFAGEKGDGRELPGLRSEDR